MSKPMNCAQHTRVVGCQPATRLRSIASLLTQRLIACLLIFSLLAVSVTSIASAQDDPNGQYLAIQMQTLNDETREVPVTVEATTLRLFFNVQAGPEITWELVSPNGRVFNIRGGNVLLTDTIGKRMVAIWDPRPGGWRVRLKGKGTFTLTATGQSDIYACCLNLIGRQGGPLDRTPLPVGSRQQATVYVSGNNVETVNFQLVNEQGEVLAPIKFRQNDFSNPYNFNLLFTMPNVPSRVRVSGITQHGLPFQRYYPAVLQPQSPTANTEATPQIAVATTDGLPPFVEGEYKIVRAEVVKYSDEPLLSAQGNPVGLRFKYTLVFPQAGVYTPQPNLYPERINNGYTGSLSLRVVGSTVTPLPEGIDRPNQILFSGRARYQSGVKYEFTVDMLPNFASYREDKKDYCLLMRSYAVPGLKERFEREINSDERIRYRLTLSGTDLDGRQQTLTKAAYSPRTWHQSFLKEGAKECQ